MKKIMLSIGMLVSVLTVNTVNAQNGESIAVLNIDAQGVLLDPSKMGAMVRTELEKLKTFSVLNAYDMAYLLKKNQVDIEGCYGTTCATEIGALLGVQKVITGSVIRQNEKIVYTLRLINVESTKAEATSLMEFENIQPQLQRMSKLVLSDLFKLTFDPIELKELEYIENPVVNKGNRLSASGPRMGVAYITQGTGPNTFREQLSARGAYPVLTQFGYQQELQYLSAGNFQALFEILGTVTGMDQNMFIPSLSLLNGFRNSKTGFEMAFGPVISMDLDANDQIQFKSKWAWAVGKTFKSGHLNVPVNIYVTPNKKEGWFVGGSFGFNLANRGRR